ncbi:4-hydroxy-tetrahydrodipicolinate synthase [Roseibacillus persicicus]|uniref:4-hydroxy-tetrahydrodipicolinate synthase n=2 Tax=Roseibacillus persicicus TaxID=454148 RepID=A0A918TMY2_9BACT|nr:4-hydroxy-tetrahydrodipicolinate synthase [Roseibacillus persicicus]GHC54840.1 4-hydroxy-tetrahydrodipicolinate synthase [Roseibacillus persicicus]
MFEGTYTALITPFRNDTVDYDAFRALIDRQAEAGMTGIVPVGTTGESPTVTTEEHLEIIRVAVEHTAGRMQVVAGTGANATAEAIHLTKAAEEMGADSSLQVCPYYNKPSQEGLYQHYKAVADATKLPIMLYSVPGRSTVSIAPETAARLANDCPNILSLKEAGGSVDRINQLVQAVPEGFELLSGDDPLTVPFMSCGATGLVSVAGNIIPDVMVRLVNACLSGDYAEALAMQKKYYPLFNALMSLDTNPVPIKSAAVMMGHCADEFRLPLVGLNEKKSAQLKAVLEEFELL